MKISKSLMSTLSGFLDKLKENRSMNNKNNYISENELIEE